jgi:L-alanine-DL-glutamate epimerase-like enolase superfamily enzyme
MPEEEFVTETADASADIRISDVIAHPLTQTLPSPTVTSWGRYTEVSICLVEVRTDAGITGVGEALARFSPRAYAEVIETSLKPRLVGQNPTAITAHWRAMRRALSGRSGGMLFEAISGVDIALWDILGKVANMPIHRLLGGMGRTEVPCYAASVNWGDDDFMDRELDRYLEKGFPRIKVKVANPVKDACRRIERLRKRAGDDIDLCVDANWAYTLEEAVEVGRALTDNRYFWFEEPIRPEDEAGYEELHRRCATPLAAGESNYTLDQAMRLVANRTLAYLQPDVARSGGITETRRMAEFAAAHDVQYRRTSACRASSARRRAFTSPPRCPTSRRWNAKPMPARSRPRSPAQRPGPTARRTACCRCPRDRASALMSIGMPSGICASSEG